MTWFLMRALLGFTVILASGCSTSDYNENDPKSVFEDAQSDIESSRYEIAMDKLRMLKNKFPYSKYSVQAKLRIADVYFLQEQYAEAAGSYEAFRELHPRHEKVPYAMFRTGESLFLDSPENIARDLTSASKALKAYRAYLGRFSDHPLSTQARNRIQEIRERLAAKELYIGNFYHREDKYYAARKRFNRVIGKYHDTESAPEARKKLESMKKYFKELEEQKP